MKHSPIHKQCDNWDKVAHVPFPRWNPNWNRTDYAPNLSQWRDRKPSLPDYLDRVEDNVFDAADRVAEMQQKLNYVYKFEDRHHALVNPRDYRYMRNVEVDLSIRCLEMSQKFKKSAQRIQAAWMSYMVRKNLKTEILNRRKAAYMIQRNYKFYRFLKTHKVIKNRAATLL